MAPTKSSADSLLVVRSLGHVPYQSTWDSMRRFNKSRTPDTSDEIWILEHPPIYTLGLNNKSAPPENSAIDIIQTDRGGQITYHGPGQLILYVLLDLERLGIGIKQLVQILEESVLQLLQAQGKKGHRKSDAPGVYVNEQKVAALGLRVRGQGSYHGLSLNIDMDLSPFADIDPCGYKGLEVTDLSSLGIKITPTEVAQLLLGFLSEKLRYTLPPEPYLTQLP